jgi:hypothetical protein
MNERKEPATTGSRTNAPQRSTTAQSPTVASARKQVTEQVDRKSTEIGKQVASAAEAVRGVGRQLREQDRTGVAKVTDQVASRVDGIASYLTEGSPDQLWQDIKNLATRQPLVFAGTCFTVGLLAGRIVKAATGGGDEATPSRSTTSAGASTNGRSATPARSGTGGRTRS